MKIILSLNILFIISISHQGLYAQKKGCLFVIKPDIEKVVSKEDKENLLTDTLSQKIELIFEQTFDDNVTIMLNDKIIGTKRMKTLRFLGVCDSTFNIDYSAYKTLPKISIILNHNTDCVSFYPVRGKQIAYIGHILRKAWSVELSNIVREYK